MLDMLTSAQTLPRWEYHSHCRHGSHRLLAIDLWPSPLMGSVGQWLLNLTMGCRKAPQSPLY